MNTTATIASISPLTADAGSAAFTLVVNGFNIDPTSSVYWNGAVVSSTFVNPTRITATITPDLFPDGGIYTVQVYTPANQLPVGDSTVSNVISFSANLSIAQAKEVVSDLIDANRATLCEGHFTWNGHPFACDPVSKGNIIGACVMAIANGGNLPPGFVWRDNNNVNVPVTGAQMIGIGVEMFTFLSTCYQAAWYHKAGVEAITSSTGDVFAYNYMSTLWPNPNVQL